MMKRILKIVRKEFIQIRRDKGLMRMVVLAPSSAVADLWVRRGDRHSRAADGGPGSSRIRGKPQARRSLHFKRLLRSRGRM